MSALRERLSAIALDFVDVIVDAIEERGPWVDQDASPLGRERHMQLARDGVLPASKDQRRILIRRADIDAYLAKKTIVTVDLKKAAESEERAIARAVVELSRRRSA